MRTSTRTCDRSRPICLSVNLSPGAGRRRIPARAPQVCPRDPDLPTLGGELGRECQPEQGDREPVTERAVPARCHTTPRPHGAAEAPPGAGTPGPAAPMAQGCRGPLCRSDLVLPSFQAASSWSLDAYASSAQRCSRRDPCLPRALPGPRAHTPLSLDAHVSALCCDMPRPC